MPAIVRLDANRAHSTLSTRRCLVQPCTQRERERCSRQLVVVPLVRTSRRRVFFPHMLPGWPNTPGRGEGGRQAGGRERLQAPHPPTCTPPNTPCRFMIACEGGENRPWRLSTIQRLHPNETRSGGARAAVQSSSRQPVCRNAPDHADFLTLFANFHVRGVTRLITLLSPVAGSGYSSSAWRASRRGADGRQAAATGNPAGNCNRAREN